VRYDKRGKPHHIGGARKDAIPRGMGGGGIVGRGWRD
jgi:hypothetical protein